MHTLEETQMCIYRITHRKSGKCYIGQTTGKVSHRWYAYTRHYSKCTKLKNAIQKYGTYAFNFEVVEICQDKSTLSAQEIYWIKIMDSVTNGYNIQKGGVRIYNKVSIKFPIFPEVTAEQWASCAETHYWDNQ